jgi:hypothetical protein
MRDRGLVRQRGHLGLFEVFTDREKKLKMVLQSLQ